MNPINVTMTAAIRTREFVNKHKFAIGVGVGIAAGLSIAKRNMNEVDEFLKEHGLYEEYWNPERN